MPLHPVINRMLSMMREMGMPSPSAQTPAQARAVMARSKEMQPVRPPRDDIEIEDRTMPGPGGNLTVRVYTPRNTRSRGRIVYFHGGGWVLGDLDTSHVICQALCAQSGCEVRSVDYRLAPEAPFPAAVDDGWSILLQSAEEPDGLPLITAGDSAGGNIAAALCLKARDSDGPTISGQILFYPVTDTDLTRESYRRLGDRGLFVTTEDMAWYWDHYLGAEADRTHPLAAVLRAASHADLPPAVIIQPDLDPLFDEGVAYAAALRNAGGEVDLHCFAGMPHGFAAFAGIIDVADEAVATASRWVIRTLAMKGG